MSMHTQRLLVDRLLTSALAPSSHSQHPQHELYSMPHDRKCRLLHRSMFPNGSCPYHLLHSVQCSLVLCNVMQCGAVQ